MTVVEFSGVFSSTKISFIVSVTTALNLNIIFFGNVMKREQCCKLPVDCRMEGLVFGRALQSVQIELRFAVHVFLGRLQPGSEIQHHQIMITSNICASEGPCLGCADPTTETVLYHGVVGLMMCSVGRMSCTMV